MNNETAYTLIGAILMSIPFLLWIRLIDKKRKEEIRIKEEYISHLKIEIKHKDRVVIHANKLIKDLKEELKHTKNGIKTDT